MNQFSSNILCTASDGENNLARARQELLKEIQRRVEDKHYDRPEIYHELVRRLSELLIKLK